MGISLHNRRRRKVGLLYRDVSNIMNVFFFGGNGHELWLGFVVKEPKALLATRKKLDYECDTSRRQRRNSAQDLPFIRVCIWKTHSVGVS